MTVHLPSQEATPASHSRAFTLAVYFFGALGELMFGYDVGVIGVALLFISKEFSLTSFTQGLVVSSLLAGAAIGVGATGALADRYGRRPLIIAMAAVFAVGGIAGALAPSTFALIAARALMGVGVGASAVVVMVYLAELAPTEHRGRIAALGQLMLVFGILLAYAVDYLLAPWGAWRWMIGLSVPPSVALLIGMFFMPESPRWLIQVGRVEEARRILRRIGQDARAEQEIVEMQGARVGDVRLVPGLTERLKVFRAQGMRRALVASLGLSVLVQLLGVNTIIYYAPTVLVSVGFGQKGAVMANLGIGTINVLLTIVALGMIDRLGRRRLLLGGSLAMTLAMLMQGSIGRISGAGSPATAWLTLASMVIFLGAFALTWGACVRVVISELLPQEARGTVMGLVLVLNWVANFFVGLLFPVMIASLGSGTTFFVFAAFGVISFAFVARFVPETNGRTLEEIQASFLKSP